MDVNTASATDLGLKARDGIHPAACRRSGTLVMWPGRERVSR